MKQEMMGWQWHQQEHMQIICTPLQLYPCQNLITHFYRPDALPDAQPCQSTEGKNRASEHTNKTNTEVTL